VVASSEAEHGHRNAALTHFLASYGNLETRSVVCLITRSATAP
jgi:glutaminase